MKTKAWHRSLGAWLFIPTFLWAINIPYNPMWLLISFALYIIIAITVTVGYHRLFTHSAFECSRFWHWFFGLVGCISLNSAPVHWSTVHINHHMFSDTTNDPYDANWRHFFRFTDRGNIKATKIQLRMMRDQMHIFFINHSLTLSIAYGCLMALFGADPFLYLYALPSTLYLVTSGVHTIFAHGNHVEEGKSSAARNLWLLEFVIPMAGEWIHREHHDNPKLVSWNTKPRYFDLGGAFIRLIENNVESPRRT